MITKPIFLENGNGRYAIVDDCDYEWLLEMGVWVEKEGYACIKGKDIFMHRLIAEKIHQENMGYAIPEKSRVDHKNGNKLYNVHSNLRIGTHQENIRNQKRRSTNRSGFKGVSWEETKQKWMASISPNDRKLKFLFWNNPEDAATAYDYAALYCFGEYCSLNFPNKPIQPEIFKCVVDKICEYRTRGWL